MSSLRSYSKKYKFIDGRNQPYIPIQLIIGTSRLQIVDCLIDTGFDGFICLASDQFKQFGLTKFTDNNLDITFVDVLGQEIYCDAVEMNIEITPLHHKKRGIVTTAPNVKDNLVGLEFLDDFDIELKGKEHILILRKN